MANYTKLLERALIKKAKTGDSLAFEELMFRSKDYLTNWILNKTKCKNETEEIVHVTYIKCWKNIKKFKGESGFKTWACSISRNLFIDEFRKKQKNRELSVGEFSGAYDYACHTEAEGYKTLRGKELKSALLKIIDGLPRIHKDVLTCFAVEELTYKEISKKLGCSLGTVMSRLFYARKKAQALIKKNAELKSYGYN